MSDAQVETPPVKEAPPEEPMQTGVTFTVPLHAFAVGPTPEEAIANVADMLPSGLVGASTSVLPHGLGLWKASVSWSEKKTIHP